VKDSRSRFFKNGAACPDIRGYRFASADIPGSISPRA